MKKPYKIKVEHKELHFFSHYEIFADDWNDAELQAKVKFKADFCNADTPLNKLNAFTIDKHQTKYHNEKY